MDNTKQIEESSGEAWAGRISWKILIRILIGLKHGINPFKENHENFNTLLFNLFYFI